MNKTFLDISNTSDEAYDLYIDKKLVRSGMAPRSGFTMEIESGEHYIRFNYAGSDLIAMSDTQDMLGRYRVYQKKGLIVYRLVIEPY